MKKMGNLGRGVGAKKFLFKLNELEMDKIRKSWMGDQND